MWRWSLLRRLAWLRWQRRWAAARVLGFALPLAAGVASGEAQGPVAAGTVLDLVPEGIASAWLPLATRTIAIVPPPETSLELFYVRSTVQELHRRGVGPLEVRIPTGRRVAADSLMVRAEKPGHARFERTLSIDALPARWVIALEPLPNRLERVVSLALAGRRTLDLWTEVPPEFRVRPADDRVHLILSETALPEPPAPVAGSGVTLVQLGADVLVTLRLAPGWAARGELRTRRHADPATGHTLTRLEWLPGDGGVASVERARAAIAALTAAAVDDCALHWEDAMRAGLPVAELARALAPTGSHRDPILSALVRRLGVLSGGRVRFRDGTALDPAHPAERALARDRAAEAPGYLALVRAFLRTLEPEEEFLRTYHALVAPERPLAALEALDRAGREREAACRSAGPR